VDTLLRPSGVRLAPVAALLLALLTYPAGAPLAQGNPTISLSGFVSGTVFTQDRNFAPGNGQSAQFVADEGAEHHWWHGGDVRNTRILLDVDAGVIASGWNVTGIIEADLFGDFPGGAFAAEQPLPRLRLAFAQIERGGTVLRLGQDWAPIYGFVPESVTHIAFPLAYGSAGLVGWRFPGLFFEQRFPAGGLQGTVHLAAMRGGWDDAPAPDQASAGQDHLVPQLQARFSLASGDGTAVPWEAFAAGHFDQKRFREDAAPDSTLEGWAATAGFRVAPGPVTLIGTGYLGRAVGQHSAHISQFGDLGGGGGFVQLGIDLPGALDLWLLGGHDAVRRADLAPGDRLANTKVAAMARIASGPFEVGVSWMHVRTTFAADAGGDRTRPGNQAALSTRLSF
jgi:hypothetical protein